jgi:hypothetical protein
MREAIEIAGLSDQSDGGHDVNAAQAHERRNDRIHVPLGALQTQRFGELLDAFVRNFHGLSIFGEGNFMGGVFKADGRKSALMGLRPGTFTVVGTAVPQQHCLQLQPRPQTSGHGILTCATVR